MTAEIAIMNKEAVAVAADSAVTLVAGPMDSPQKIFTSATKIYGLPNNHTVALMIYNNASFLGIPWEPLITRFEETLGKDPLPNLTVYADRLIRFLAEEKSLVSAEIEQQYFTTMIYNYYLTFRFIFQAAATQLMRQQGTITEDQIASLVADKVSEAYGSLMGAEYIPGADENKAKDLISRYSDITAKAMGEVFEQLPILEQTRDQLRVLPILFFVKNAGTADPASQNFSGIVITGFGKDEIFPALVTYAIEGRLGGLLKYREIENRAISLENGAYVIPFAQRDMVEMFMAGMDSRLYNALTESLAAVLSEFPKTIVDSIETLDGPAKEEVIQKFQPQAEDLINQIAAYLNNYRNSNVIPIINVVLSLPKTELAAMAESLVNLTSLKRKVSLTAETVGGPVDVAVISKRDGFVWIKRKQYFSEDLNQRGHN